ncbi:MarR family winged helix-turn-helix transcriptional regulator [Desulfofalx alkaliphila]|uniref:MarR family winged helix-turn-helix transcriptional regulator n=1 Tax=Desulfofalx alkaliphila TaxID=105483 RepID=UPI000558536B|nr:MarR family transcriptional regulator [Desulfofalx alkaliphila]
MKKGNALSLISRIREKATKLIIKELEGHGIEGIVPSHGDILVILFQGERYTMKELADKIHRTKPTVTVLIEKLVQYGFVEKEKDSEDARLTYVKLTKKGRQLKPIFDTVSGRLNAVMYGDLTEKEAETFENLLERVNATFDRNMNLQ